MSEPAYTKVTGAFYAPQKIEGRPVALSGKITFTPTAPVLIPGSGVHSSQARTGWVREGKLYESANAPGNRRIPGSHPAPGQAGSRLPVAHSRLWCTFLSSTHWMGA